MRLAPLGNVCNRLLLFPAAVGTFGALPFASMIPTFQGPGLRKHPGVGLTDLLHTERTGYRCPWSTRLFTSSALKGGVVDPVFQCPVQLAEFMLKQIQQLH